MPVLEVQRRVKAHGAVIWKVISNIAGIAELAPHVSRVDVLGGQGVGLRLRIYDLQGNAWEEECIGWDEGRSLTMRVNPGRYPFAFSAMTYRWSLTQDDNDILICMRYDYSSRYGILGPLLDRVRFRTGFESVCAELMDGWIRQIHERECSYRETVGTILAEKGRGVISVQPSATVSEAALLLSRERIGSLLVLADDGGIAGVLSERDIVRGLAEQGGALLSQAVTVIMTRKVIVAASDDNMLHVMSQMSRLRIRHLPVVDSGEVIGIVSIGDVVKARIAELEGKSESLRDYIEARRWREKYLEMGPAAFQGGSG